jgi:hypothetical protein
MEMATNGTVAGVDFAETDPAEGCAILGTVADDAGASVSIGIALATALDDLRERRSISR